MTLEQLLEGTVIAIDKPRQWTSFQVVNKVKSVIRQTYGIKKFKIGHAGTLDPLATGLLLVCVGKATKRIDELQSGEKVYTGTMVLGATTPCYDLERAIDHYYPYQHITLELIQEKLSHFTGPIEQVPPIFSAVKIDGQRAYVYAREAKMGDEIPSPTPKKILVKEIAITNFRQGEKIEPLDLIAPTEALENSGCQSHLYNHPQGIIPEHLPQIDFRICCGKGTYIRSLARDIGLALDSGAFLASLRREKIGDYSINDAISLESIQDYLAK